MNLSRKIETTANLATIAVAVVISTVLLKAYFVSGQSGRSFSVASVPETFRGKSLDAHVLGVDWARNQRTLVLAISTTCHFCTESAPFFRRLAAANKDVKTVAVLPQPVSEAMEYLRGEGVQVDEVRQVPLNVLGVRGTPTLLLVNNAGIVTDVWVGKLEREQESQVLSAIAKKETGL